MANKKRISKPGLIQAVYHAVFCNIGNYISKCLLSLVNLCWKLLRNTSFLIWYIVRSIIITPIKIGKFILNVLYRLIAKINNLCKPALLNMWNKTRCIHPTISVITNTIWDISKWCCKQLYNLGWWIMHQVALTKLEQLRSLDKKPLASFGWALWQEFFPRYKLEYWMADSHITVEVSKWSYNNKLNKLRYVETGTCRKVCIHSPHGIGHVATHLRWWEPTVNQTVRPYTPIHSLPQKLVK